MWRRTVDSMDVEQRALLFNEKVIAYLREDALWRAWAVSRDNLFEMERLAPPRPSREQHQAALKLYPQKLVDSVLARVRAEMQLQESVTPGVRKLDQIPTLLMDPRALQPRSSRGCARGNGRHP